jgi:hypothetical protein
MKSICFFYKSFVYQELALKLNSFIMEDITVIKKCLVFKPKPKDVANDFNSPNNDLRYVFEFLTKIKVVKSYNSKLICSNLISQKQTINILLSFSYLIFTKTQLTLENSKLDSHFPVIQKRIKGLNVISHTKNYLDLKFNNGLDLAFLSDNEYVSYIPVEFYIRWIFSLPKINKNLFYYKQLLALSVSGLKYSLIYKKKYGKR